MSAKQEWIDALLGALSPRSPVVLLADDAEIVRVAAAKLTCRELAALERVIVSARHSDPTFAPRSRSRSRSRSHG